MLFHFRTPRTRGWEKYLKKLQKHFDKDEKTAFLTALLMRAHDKRETLVKLLEECAKDVSRPDDIIKLLDIYIPAMEDLIEGIEANNIKLVGWLDSVWTSFLTLNINSKSLSNTLQWEKIMIYTLYALAHYQKAVEIHHLNRSISQKAKEKHKNQTPAYDPIFDDPKDFANDKPQIFDNKEKVKEISQYLKKASSIWLMVSSTLYPVLVNEQSFESIPETFQCVIAVLSNVAAINSQEFMIQLAVQTNKSFSLTSKLSAGVSKKLRECDKSLSGNLGKKVYESVRPDFRMYLQVRSGLYHSIALKYTARLLKKEEKHGACIGYYNAAIKILKKTQTRFPQKQKEMSSSIVVMQKSVKKQIASINKLCQAATSENNSVYFDVVPKPDAIEDPEPKFVIKIEQYKFVNI